MTHGLDHLQYMRRFWKAVCAPRPRWANAHDIMSLIDGQDFGKLLILPLRLPRPNGGSENG